MSHTPKTSRGGTFQLNPGSNKATLICSEGYKLPIVITSKLVNGTWDPPQLDCLPLSTLLELPATDTGGKVSSTSNPPYHFNDKATLKCDYGYTYSSIPTSKVIVDKDTLKWEPSKLSCKKVVCEVPPDVDNTKPINSIVSYQFGDSFMYECLPGFVLQTISNQYFCGANGAWQPAINARSIKCLPDPNWCPEVIPPSNGTLHLSNGWYYESVASFSCDQGYTVIGGNRICQEDRTWSGNEALCIPVLVCPPMDPSVKFFANDTFNLVACGAKLVKVRCINGQWEYNYPYCDMIKNTSHAGPVQPLPQIVKPGNNPPPPTSNPLPSTKLPIVPVHLPAIQTKVPKTNSFFSFTVWTILVTVSMIIIFLIFKMTK